MKKFNNFSEVNKINEEKTLTLADDDVYVDSIKIMVNLYESIVTASDESEKEFNDWFFSFDFGSWKAESFDRVHYSVFYLELSNETNYDDYRNIVEIIQENAKRILKPLSE